MPKCKSERVRDAEQIIHGTLEHLYSVMDLAVEDPSEAANLFGKLLIAEGERWRSSARDPLYSAETVIIRKAPPTR